MKTDLYDAIVIGAGMVGSACALALAEAGQRVLIVDHRPIGSLTTSKGMGHIGVTPERPALLSLTAYSRRLWQRILASLDVETDYLSCGTMWLASSDAATRLLEDRLARLRAADVFAELIEGRVLHRMEPNLGAMVTAALHVPADCVVTPARVASLLIDAALGHGSRTMLGFDVEHIQPGAIRLCDGQVLSAKAIILAGGYLSARLIPNLPLRPRKGHIVVAESPNSYCFHQLVEIDYLIHAHSSDQESVACNVQPRPETGGGGSGGRVWIGSSRQYHFSSDAPDPDMIERMMRRAEEFLPTIRSLRVISTRAGFRPASRDGLPLIGPLASMPGVYVATGHEGIGITASMGTARLIADMILGRASEIDPAPFLPARFSDL